MKGGGRRRLRRDAADARVSAASGREGAARQAQTVSDFPRWIAPILFAAMTLFLFREFVFSDRMLFGSDTLGLGYMARAFFADALSTTGFPLWNPVLLGGTPFIESLAGGDSLYPPSLLLLVTMETYRALGWKLVLHVFLAGVFMHAWLRELEVSRAGALVGGLAYMLTPTLVTLVFPGNDGKLFVTALTPLLFWVVERVYRRKGALPLAAAGAVVALVILTTQFQMAYFLFGGAGAYAIFRSVEAGRLSGMRKAMIRLGAFVLFCVLGVGAAGVQLLPAVAYVTEHSRRAATTVAAEPEAAIAYSSSWSLHPEEVVGLVVPEFVGSSVGGAGWATETYWGRNQAKLNHEYLGVVALLLAALSFLGARARRVRWFIVAMSGAALLFGLGAHTPVWRIAYEILPGIALFRAPGMVAFLTAFGVATLAGMGAERALELVARGETGRLVRVLAVAVGVLALGAVLAGSGTLTGVWTAVVYREIEPAKLEALARAGPFLTRGLVLATLLALATLALWWARGKGVLNESAAVLLLGLLVATDEVRVDRAFIQTIDPAAFLEPDPSVQFLLDRAESEPPFRVLSMFQNGQDVTPGMHGLDLVGGHHPNDLWRYRELIGMEGSGIPEHLVPEFNPNVMRILGIHYVLWPEAQYGPLDGAEPLNRTTFADGRPYASVYAYPGLPRARIVGEALVVPEDRTLAVVLGEEGAYDPAQQAVLTEPPPFELGGAGVIGSASWVERTPNRLVLEVETSGPALLVLSENWFPSWRASVDGEPVRVLRADHTLRAVGVPAGSHRVQMWYESSLLRLSAGVSAACVIVLGMVAGMGARGGRHRSEAGE